MNSVQDIFSYYFRFGYNRPDDCVVAQLHYNAAKHLIDAFCRIKENYEGYMKLIYNLHNKIPLTESQKDLLNKMGFNT